MVQNSLDEPAIVINRGLDDHGLQMIPALHVSAILQLGKAAGGWIYEGAGIFRSDMPSKPRICFWFVAFWLNTTKD